MTFLFVSPCEPDLVVSPRKEYVCWPPGILLLTMYTILTKLTDQNPMKTLPLFPVVGIHCTCLSFVAKYWRGKSWEMEIMWRFAVLHSLL